MARLPILPLYVADYRADTARLSTEQHGAYLLLLMDQWMNGPIPDDDDVLARITGLMLGAWLKHRPSIEPFFVIGGDGVRTWSSRRLEVERQAVHQRREKN